MKKWVIAVMAVVLVISISALTFALTGAPSKLSVGTDPDWSYDESNKIGDANNDYSVNLLDLVRMKKYIAFVDTASEPYINSSVCDYNSDSDIDSNDLAALRKQLLSFSDTELISSSVHTVGLLDETKVDKTALMTLSQEPSSELLKNPYKGWYVYGDGKNKTAPFAADQDTAWEYASVGYIRYNWSIIEPEEGKFDWDYIDNAIAYCKARGSRFAFGIMSADPSSADSYVTPKWVFDAGAEYYFSEVNDTIGGEQYEQYIPNFGNSIYVEKVQNLANALAERYGDNDSIEFIDIRCYGSWGENNMYDISALYKDQDDTGVNADDMWRCWETYINAFKGKRARLIVAYSLRNNALMDVFERAMSLGVGIRNDGVLHWQSQNYGETNIWAKDKVPSVLELAASYEYLKSMGSWDSDVFEQTVLNTRTSYYPLGGAWYADAAVFINEQKDLIERMSNSFGYHLTLNSIEVSKSLGKGNYDAIYMNFENSGNAPLLVKSHIAAALIDENGKAIEKCWLDGVDIRSVKPSADISDENKSITLKSPLILNGSSKAYRLAIGVFSSKTNENPDIRLGNKNVLQNGWCVVYNPAEK